MNCFTSVPKLFTPPARVVRGSVEHGLVVMQWVFVTVDFYEQGFNAHSCSFGQYQDIQPHEDYHYDAFGYGVKGDAPALSVDTFDSVAFSYDCVTVVFWFYTEYYYQNQKDFTLHFEKWEYWHTSLSYSKSSDSWTNSSPTTVSSGSSLPSNHPGGNYPSKSTNDPCDGTGNESWRDGTSTEDYNSDLLGQINAGWTM